MNSKELIKKIDIGRVGNGTQTHNDMCLILSKEETLEHLQYVEQIEIANKNNEGLVRENVDLINRNLKLQEELKRSQDTIKKWMDDHKQLIIDNGKMKKSLDILKNKRVNISQLLKTTFIVYNSLAILLGYDKLTQEEYELLKEVLEE